MGRVLVRVRLLPRRRRRPRRRPRRHRLRRRLPWGAAVLARVAALVAADAALGGEGRPRQPARSRSDRRSEFVRGVITVPMRSSGDEVAGTL